MEKCPREYHHLGNKSEVKNHKSKMMKLKRNYTLLIGIGIIGNSNYTQTSLSGLIK